jgi:hypothetical protein
MKQLFAAGSLLLIMSAGLSARMWIGQVTDQHCAADHKALEGDDARCIVLIANDHEVYTVENQDAVRPHIGHDVQISGTLNEEMVIGISYETQGILHVDSVKMLSPMELSAEDKAKFQGWMKAMQPQVVAVRNVITSKDKTPLGAESDKLSGMFAQVADFMKQHQSADAVQFAETARDAAKSIGAVQLQVEQILALRKVSEACSGCHVAHRAGKQGDYKIQP